MHARLFAISFAIAACGWTQPREKATDFPAHAKLADREIGAEYLVHSVPVERGVLVASDYLVVEVAVFPLTLAGVSISSGQFTLRINGKKNVIFAQSPGMVAASIKYPDYEGIHPRLEGQAGPLIFGRPRAVERFPGDPSARTGPPAPRVPDAPDQGATEREPRKTIEEQVAAVALADEVTSKPRRGVLFFPFQGKTKGIRSLELLCEVVEGRPVGIQLF